MQDKLAVLSHLSESLNSVTDTYTKSLAEMQATLRKMNLGIKAWVPLSEVSKSGEPMRNKSIWLELGYAKTREGWGFAVRKVRRERGYYEGELDCPWTDEYIEEDPTPLLKESREVRLEASEQVERLLDELQRRGKELLESVAKANIALSS
jgi:hypothetical protein